MKFVQPEGLAQGDVNFQILSAVKTTKIPQKHFSSDYKKLNSIVIREWVVSQKIPRDQEEPSYGPLQSLKLPFVIEAEILLGNRDSNYSLKPLNM